jgi:formyl-CoA transferase
MIENFRSGAIDRMGFGFDAAAVRNPRIVFCSSSGFGREGDMAGLPCTDPHIQAFSGFATLNGDTKGGERSRYYGMIDLYCGQLICEAVLAALLARRSADKPQYIEMTMLGGATSMLVTKLAGYLRGGPAPTHRDARHSAPDGLYSTSDGAIALTVESDTGFRALCIAIEREDLVQDERFITCPMRLANMQALDAELQKAFAAAPSDWWLVSLRRAGIACAPVHSDYETSTHRDTWARGHLREIAVRNAGRLRAAAPPWDFDGIDQVAGQAPRPGEHSDLLHRDPANFWIALEQQE